MYFYFMFCFRIIIRDSLPFEAVQDLEIMTELGTSPGKLGALGKLMCRNYDTVGCTTGQTPQAEL